MDPERCIRNGFVNGRYAHCHFYAACTSRHESSMIPKALKFATLQKKMAPMNAKSTIGLQTTHGCTTPAM